MSCPAHDKGYLWDECTCSPERKWARNKMLRDTLVKIAAQTKEQEQS